MMTGARGATNQHPALPALAPPLAAASMQHGAPHPPRYRSRGTSNMYHEPSMRHANTITR
eukprot:scaffold6178_cov118-Isochrysis_galbana.AAC.1